MLWSSILLFLLSACMFVSLSACLVGNGLPACLVTCLFYLPACSVICLPVCLVICLAACWVIFLPACLVIWLPYFPACSVICLPACLVICPEVCLVVIRMPACVSIVFMPACLPAHSFLSIWLQVCVPACLCGYHLSCCMLGYLISCPYQRDLLSAVHLPPRPKPVIACLNISLHIFLAAVLSVYMFSAFCPCFRLCLYLC